MIDAIWDSVRRLREAAPLVHNITNYVVMNNTANALLAIGASPAMVHSTEEVEDFAAISGALVVNIGTLSPAWVAGMKLAVQRANEKKIRWALDPVGVGATRYRNTVSAELAALKPTVIRGNASEILALAGAASGPTKGVDSTASSDDTLEPARRLAALTGGAIAVTGKTDYVTDGKATRAIHNGHAMMARVTGLGCSATALISAFLAVTPDPLAAATHALAVFGVAGEMAAEKSPGPGSLQLHLLDALYALDRAELQRRAKVE
jgi:hydroxyethylthiazole kinase